MRDLVKKKVKLSRGQRKRIDIAWIMKVSEKYRIH